MKWRDGLGIIRSADSRSEGDYVAPWIADASLHPRFSGDFMALPRVLSSLDIKDALGAAMQIVPKPSIRDRAFLADEIAPVMSAGEGSPYQETHP